MLQVAFLTLLVVGVVLWVDSTPRSRRVWREHDGGQR